MFDEFVLEVLFIKIKVKSHLKNITEKTEEKIETTGIKNSNKITYHIGATIIKIIINEDNIKLIRENEEFIHTFNFKLNKETISEYYIKEYNTNIEVKTLTTKLLVENNKISINYTIIESENEYNYIIDME